MYCCKNVFEGEICNEIFRKYLGLKNNNFEREKFLGFFQEMTGSKCIYLFIFSFIYLGPRRFIANRQTNRHTRSHKRIMLV